MKICFYNIRPELAGYVKSICTMELNAISAPMQMRVLPDTCVELFLSFSASPLASISGHAEASGERSFITSRMSSYMDVEMKAGSSCMAICFFPGKAFPFFNVPMNEISDKAVSLGELWRKWIHEIEERFYHAENNNTRAGIMQHYLLEMLARQPADDAEAGYLLWQLNQKKGMTSIKEIENISKISYRQLSRRFESCTGLSPKRYARSVRFINALDYLKKDPGVLLTSAAYDCGYYDQAHFIHDFQAFSGMPPGAVLTKKGLIF